MTKEITMKQAVNEINRLNRERDALKQQLADLREFAYERAPKIAAEEARSQTEGLIRQLAEATADIEELVFCECCGGNCVKIPENATHPPRYCHDCYLNLRAEIADLKAQLAEAKYRLAELEAYDANLQRLERERWEAEARANAAEKNFKALCQQTDQRESEVSDQFTLLDNARLTAESDAQRMRGILEKALPLIDAEADRRDYAHRAPDDKDPYFTEMRDIADEIRAAIGEGKDSIQECAECGKYPADLPSKLCVGCAAYKEHTAI